MQILRNSNNAGRISRKFLINYYYQQFFVKIILYGDSGSFHVFFVQLVYVDDFFLVEIMDSQGIALVSVKS